MHWALLMTLTQAGKEAREKEDKQANCPHRNVRITGSFRPQRYREHKDGLGYTVRFLAPINEGRCKDCGALMRETHSDSNEYCLDPLV